MFITRLIFPCVLLFGLAVSLCAQQLSSRYLEQYPVSLPRILTVAQTGETPSQNGRIPVFAPIQPDGPVPHIQFAPSQPGVLNGQQPLAVPNGQRAPNGQRILAIPNGLAVPNGLPMPNGQAVSNGLPPLVILNGQAVPVVRAVLPNGGVLILNQAHFLLLSRPTWFHLKRN